MKRARMIGSLCALCFLLMADATMASTSMGEITEAAHRTGDKSRQALVSIFGQIVNNPLAAGSNSGGDTIVASVFQVINGALLVVGAIFVSYVLFKRIFQTANDGSIFGRDKTTFWGPIRLVFGICSLVPTANGWCGAQLLMLWAASVMGVGIANLGTDGAIAAFDDGKSMVVQPAMPDTVDLARSIFEMNLCLHAINAGLAQAQAAGALVTSDGFVQITPTDAGYALKNSSYVCGGAEIDKTLIEPASQSTNWFSGTIDTSTVYQAHIQALSKMQSDLNEAAYNFVTKVLDRQLENSVVIPDAQTSIESAALAYENLVNKEAGTKQGDIANLAGQLSSSIKDAGWWTLGAWYQTFAQANSKLSNSVSGKAKTFGESYSGDQAYSSLKASVQTAYQAQQASSKNTSALGRVSSTGSADANSLVSSVFSGPGQRIVHYMANMDAGAEARGTVNPLIKMKNLGDYTLGAAEGAVGIYVAAKVAQSYTSGFNVAGLATRAVNAVSGVVDAINGAIDAMSPILLLILIPLFVLGAGLSIYLPLVPFIIWFGAITNWLVIVCEAIVAAPLWAMTHMGDDGDGMGQRTGHGYIFLLNVMIRPILMVAGFFLGGAILIAGGTILNEMYGIAVANVQFDSITGVVSVIVFLGVYFMMCLNLVHSCFNLIFVVPDQVINWVGGNAPATLGREANDQIKNSLNVFGSKIEQLLPKSPKSDSGKPKPDGNGMKG